VCLRKRFILISSVSLASFIVFISCPRTLLVAQSNKNGGYIYVRLIDANSGKPLKGISLGFLVREKGRAARLADGVTDSNGRTTLRLPTSVPERIGISYPLGVVWFCSDEAFPTSEILRTGIVAKYTCKGGKIESPPTPAPREIVLFTRRVSWFEQLRREIP
jgi:hypothetical protein